MVNQPTVISLFSGCGGSSLGYKWAGYRELLAIDFDKNAVETFRLNFPDVPCWQRDIREVTGKEILDFCHIKPGELDLLDASPPCQGFSTAGKRKVIDPRNDLFREFVRLIKELQPKVFVMENVSGMAKGKMRGRFNEILQELRGTEYQVKCKLMNAKWYRVPQSRQRLIWIGSKDNNPSFPKQTKKLISVKEAIGKNGFIEYRHNYHKGSVHFKRSSFNKPALTLTKSGLGQKIYYDTHGQYLDKAYSINRPLSAITAGNSHHLTIGESKEQSRQFTIEEALVLSSFPKDFQLIGPFKDQWARIGNAVPPKMMEAIARIIRERIFDHASIS